MIFELTVRQAMPSARNTRVRRRGITERGAVLSLMGTMMVFNLICKIYVEIYLICKIHVGKYLGAAASRH